MFHIKNGVKEGDVLSSLLFNFALEYAIKKVKTNHKFLKFNGTHQVVIYVDDINLWGHSIHTIRFNSRSKCWECWKYVSVPWKACSTKTQHINTYNKYFESVEKVQIFVNNSDISKLHSERNQQQQNALENASYHLVQNHLPNSLLPKNVKIKIHKTITLNVVLYGCETWSLTRMNTGWGCLKLGCWEWYLGLKGKGNRGMKKTILWAGS